MSASGIQGSKAQHKVVDKAQGKTSLGFTLIELLVVISIIAILMALGLAAYSAAQKRGRDARRRKDIKAMQDAAEQYYAVNGSYPTADGDLSSEYLPGGMPSDPKSTYSYTKEWASDAYCLAAEMESANGTCGACSGTSRTSGSTHFCLVNQQ